MKISKRIMLTIAIAFVTGAKSATLEDHDPYIWLSDIHGARATAWVAAENARSNAALTIDPRYAVFREEILKSLDTEDRIPLVNVDHGSVYNFWQDAAHVRGLWRRAGVTEYRNANPNWDILLDVDKYDSEQHKNWVFQGASCSTANKRCLIDLSPGGGDANEIFEFDPAKRVFLPDGFHLALAKSTADYIDDDTVLIATDFGPGTLTKSSYPRIVKIWHRGQPLAAAVTVFEARPDDIAARPVIFRGPWGTLALIDRGLTFFTSDFYAVLDDNTTLKLPIPQGADLKGVTSGQLVFTLRDDWDDHGRTLKQGSLVAFDLVNFIKTKTIRPASLLYSPDAHSTVDTVSAGRDAVYAAVFENITGSVHAFTPGVDGTWSNTNLDLPAGGTTEVMTADDWSPEAYFTYESFLVPPTLFEGKGDGHAVVSIKSQKPLFDAHNLVSEQFWARSKDGTKISYFIVHDKDAKGPLPTILYSYGGFELTLFPWYWNDGHRPLDAGEVWLSRGGAIAVANIRGGGEFGPAWHQAALKYHHRRAFDDFAAVAEDMIAKNFATPKTLGIVGASNGGLLVSATMVEHPDLFAAVVCQRPLIDMLRYTQFGAGASWVDEYGDPADPNMRAYIKTYSPYQNVKAGTKMPPVLFITETSDDRVTPVFARMMAAEMEAQGHDVLFNEAAEGGHGPGSTNAAQADMWALTFTYFAEKLGLRR
jgi:prolyl oligopeptidase